MLTFSLKQNNAICCSGGPLPLEIFAEKPNNDGISLFATPQENLPERTVSWPGEYDFSGITIHGIGHDEGQRVSYTIETDGKRCAFINSPLHDWSDNELELLGDIDVLCIPGDDIKLAQKLIDEIDPRVLIPINTKPDIFAEILKICGAQNVEPVLETKVKSLPIEGREVIVLSS